jgi:hypothetical protein
VADVEFDAKAGVLAVVGGEELCKGGPVRGALGGNSMLAPLVMSILENRVVDGLRSASGQFTPSRASTEASTRPVGPPPAMSTGDSSVGTTVLAPSLVARTVMPRYTDIMISDKIQLDSCQPGP